MWALPAQVRILPSTQQPSTPLTVLDCFLHSKQNTYKIDIFMHLTSTSFSTDAFLCGKRKNLHLGCDHTSAIPSLESRLGIMPNWIQCSRPSSSSFRMLIMHSWMRGLPLTAPAKLLNSNAVVSIPSTRGVMYQTQCQTTRISFLNEDKPLVGLLISRVHSRDVANSGLSGRFIHVHHQGRVLKSLVRSLMSTAALSPSEEMVTVKNHPKESGKVWPARIKKKVAMWVGYVGTRYKGLQIQRGAGTSQTIEAELERALHEVGGIIESNFGNLEKISWTRSSRTDKGVHSLCTVISMKMEVPEAAWVNDGDGLALADNINLHLPQFIRVFGIVPVTRSFRARHDCFTRSYHYLLPAAILGINLNTPLSEVEKRVKKFQSILLLFEGKHPYHNYTIRRLYRHFPQKPFSSRQGDRSDENKGLDMVNENTKRVAINTMSDGSSISTKDVFRDEEDMSDELADVLTSELADEMLSTFAEESRGERRSLEKSIAVPTNGCLAGRRAWWLPTPDESDKVWSSHFRKVLSFRCELPERAGESHFLRISITGSSFMVHQIRKMVGTAVAVFRELLPGDIIPISLARHSRIVLPLAPPDGLILASNDFMPFRIPPIHQKKADIEANMAPVVRRREDLPKLEMSEAIATRADEFCWSVLMPEVLPLVSATSPNWSAWVENLERNVKIPDVEMAEVRAAWAEWREQSVRLRQMRKQIDDEWLIIPQSKQSTSQ